MLSKSKVKIQHEVTADRISITERIHELTPVILVANDVPAPQSGGCGGACSCGGR